jgi:hypothetical protein
MESSSSTNKTHSRRRRKSKSICLPFDESTEYPCCMEDHAYCVSIYWNNIDFIPSFFRKRKERDLPFTVSYTRRSRI